MDTLDVSPAHLEQDARRATPADTCATQPMGRALRLLGDVPTLLIIVTLLGGRQRFGALRAALGDVSPKTIAQRLRMLVELGFVRREAFAEIPPRVEYHLTEKGFALADIMAAIKEFGERFLAEGLAVGAEAEEPAAASEDAGDGSDGGEEAGEGADCS